MSNAFSEIETFLRGNFEGRDSGPSVDEMVEKVRKTFYGRKLDKVLEKPGFSLAGFSTAVPNESGGDATFVAFNKKHKGIFPFPHDHCTLELCDETGCIVIEYPCNIDWPWPLDIFV